MADKEIMFVKDENGNSCVQVQDFINDVYDLLDDYRYILNKNTLKFDILHTSYTVQEDPSDADNAIIKCTDESDKSKFIEKTIPLVNLEDYFLNTQKLGVHISNEKDFCSYLKDYTEELFNKYYKDNYIQIVDLIRNSNIVFMRDDSPIFVSGIHTKKDINIIKATHYKLGKTNVGLYINFADIDREDVKYVHSPYEKIYYALFDIEEDKESEEEPQNKDLDLYALFYNKQSNCIFKFVLKFTGVFFTTEKVEVLEDYKYTKDFVFEHYDDPFAIYNEIADVSSRVSAIDILSWID